MSIQLSRPSSPSQRRLWPALALIALGSLSACGSDEEAPPEPITEAQAVRFLEQASFGPTPEDVARLQSLGYGKWIDEQFAQASTLPTHLQMAEATAQARSVSKPDGNDVTYSWWTHAIKDNAQLRQRVAFALSEIFVISTASDNLAMQGRMVASFMDMLARNSSTTYRQLLEEVALHPAMGAYLSHRGNRKEDASSGRVPDENFAREVMQLFSIGLYELNPDGSPRLNNGQPIETYTANDVKGLAKVFTGFSWNWPSTKSALVWWKCFWRTAECTETLQETTSMSGYAQEHSTSVKQFLGTTIDAQTTANPQQSLQTALDRLANHPNTAPFISRQLIQRLVTSNPSPSYVQDVASTFRSSRGNLKEVVRAILLHAEARKPSDPETSGKLREPVLRLAHLMRSLPHTSDTYSAQAAAGGVAYYPLGETDNPGTSLSQTPMRAPSVFNFFRPGYIPPQTELGARGMMAPEMQLTTETTVVGYANFIASILNDGLGKWDSNKRLNDIRFDLTSFEALADQPAQMVSAVHRRLLGTEPPADLTSEAVAAIESMPNRNVGERRKRAQAAVLLVAVSPSFLVQQ